MLARLYLLEFRLFLISSNPRLRTSRTHRCGHSYFEIPSLLCRSPVESLTKTRETRENYLLQVTSALFSDADHFLMKEDSKWRIPL